MTGTVRLVPGARANGSIPTAKERGHARAFLNRLVARYPSMGTALDYVDAYQLLVVTVLSAQTTDENVNKVAPKLFERYPTAADLAEADPEEVETIIYSTGFFRQKTKSIIKLSQGIDEMFDGLELQGVELETSRCTDNANSMLLQQMKRVRQL